MLKTHNTNLAFR